jgi:GT2 family glycosyltransferase
VSTPRVSVVVSTYDRPQRLAKLLDALEAQTLARDQFEVVVVDNGSGPETGAVLDRPRDTGRHGADASRQTGDAAQSELQLRTLRHERTLGPAGGRNSGWRAAAAPLVAFTDDDCAPTPSWLEGLLEAADRRPGAIVQGQTRPDPQELAAAGGQLLLTRTVQIDGAGPQYETCNILYPRALLEELGGFDPDYGMRPAGEDTDLAWRALERGVQVTYAPDALVDHAVVRLTPRQALTEATRWGGCARLFAAHPGARVMLHRQIFWNVWHYLLIRSLLTLIVPLPRPLKRQLRRVLLRTHTNALRKRARELGAGSWAIPYLLAYDALETAAMVRGAVRHRTPLL